MFFASARFDDSPDEIGGHRAGHWRVGRGISGAGRGAMDQVRADLRESRDHGRSKQSTSPLSVVGDAIDSQPARQGSYRATRISEIARLVLAVRVSNNGAGEPRAHHL